MASMQKGVVTQVVSGGEKAIVRPFGAGSALTPELPVQKITVKRPEFQAHANEYNTGEHPEMTFQVLHPALAVGDAVAFVLFEDGTGLIIDKIQ